ncbi:MAG TPA: non-homologous end-joining DNA ligase [Roseiarcus sp.]
MKASNPSNPPITPSRGATRAAAQRAAEPTPITHADRVIFPSDGVTKGDVAGYYARVAERMTPYLEQRLVSIIRAPDNVETETFFQRHPTSAMKRGVIRVTEGDKVYMALEGAEGLRTAAQFGGVEFHGWMSRIDSLDQPDRLIFDLDPDPSVSFADVKAAAQDIARRLEAIDVKTWPMMSGGKGVHVVAPLDRSLTTDEVETFARAFAHGLAEKEPARFIASMSKSRRTGRIFIDWMRNKKGSTAILPWSLRARPTAPVATPLTWRSLEDASSAAQYTIKTAVVLADPWGEFLTRAQTIPTAVLTAAR